MNERDTITVSSIAIKFVDITRNEANILSLIYCKKLNNTECFE